MAAPSMATKKAARTAGPSNRSTTPANNHDKIANSTISTIVVNWAVCTHGKRKCQRENAAVAPSKTRQPAMRNAGSASRKSSRSQNANAMSAPIAAKKAMAVPRPISNGAAAGDGALVITVS